MHISPFLRSKWKKSPAFHIKQCFWELSFFYFLFISFTVFYTFNSLPNDKILDRFKLKAFVDYKLNVNEKLYFGLERVQNIVGKGENASYQHFLLFPQCFQKLSFSGIVQQRANFQTSTTENVTALVNPASALTETSILYTDGHTDAQIHRWTDRLIPVYPQKHLFCGGINIIQIVEN